MRAYVSAISLINPPLALPYFPMGKKPVRTRSASSPGRDGGGVWIGGPLISARKTPFDGSLLQGLAAPVQGYAEIDDENTK